MAKYTVIYTKRVGSYGGALVLSTQVETTPKKSFEDTLEAKEMDIAQVVHVFHGWHDPIHDAWDELP